MSNNQRINRLWYVLTGGPCAGKTTLLQALKDRGYRVIYEAARDIIERELQKGRMLEDIRRNERSFQEDVLREKMAREREVSKNELLFFDRGIPDSLAYYYFFQIPIDAELKEALESSSYKKVFLLDMLDYVQDNTRTETSEEAHRIHALLEQSYRDLHIPLICVPVLPVPERLQFIIDNL